MIGADIVPSPDDKLNSLKIEAQKKKRLERRVGIKTRRFHW